MGRISLLGALLVFAVLLSAIVSVFFSFQDSGGLLGWFSNTTLVDISNPDLVRSEPIVFDGNTYKKVEGRKILVATEGMVTAIETEKDLLRVKRKNDVEVDLFFPDGTVVYGARDLDLFRSGVEFFSLPQLTREEILVGQQVSYSYAINKGFLPSVVIY